jgi:hypothetical protein
VISIVAKSWTFEGYMGRFAPQSLSPKTTQIRKPGIRNTRSVEHMLKVFSVEVRITSRAGI